MTDHKLRVLLVEDDEDDYLIVREFLSAISSSAYGLEWVRTYQSAMEVIDQDRYDICLLDYRLGEHSGLDIIRRISERGCTKPVILLTGYGDYDLDMQAMELGATDYLVKGEVNAPLLERSIRYAIERKRSEEDLRLTLTRLRESNEELSSTLEELQIAEEELRQQNIELTSTKMALEAERQRYIDLFENAPDAYLVTDTNGLIIEANTTAAGFLGAGQEFTLGKPLAEFIPEEDRQAFRRELHYMKFLEGVKDWEVHLKPRDGEPFFASISVARVRSLDGDRVTLRWLIRDISERKRAEEAIQNSEEQLRFLSSKLLTAQEEERKKIAREIHDSIGSSLSAIKFSLENFLQNVKNDSVPTETLTRLIDHTQLSIDEARRIMTDLHPSILDDLGLITTIGWFGKQYQATYSGIRLDTRIDMEENEIPEPLKIIIFRIMQEAFNNIAKYSRAELVNLSLVRKAGAIQLTIGDNGVGFDTNAAIARRGPKGGLGLSSMRERAQLSGGSFSIESYIGDGTTIRASWPIQK